jgi:hypothetical protein
MEKEEKNEEEIEDLNFEKPDYVFDGQKHHDYRQQGYYLICKSCEIEHAVWIGENKLMVGTDKDGKPILEVRSN